MSMYVCIKFPKVEFYYVIKNEYTYVIKNEYTYANMMEYSLRILIRWRLGYELAYQEVIN